MTPAILRPNHNVWRIERAARAAVLIDGAAFFKTVRQTFIKAQHSIFVLGWDIDSRTRLVGDSNAPDDGLPATLSEFLTELVRRRPALQVHLLLWDYSMLYAGERELLPRMSLQWSTPEQITLCLDNIVPFGCSQHQKIVVVDDAVAFSGGLDLTIRRWDTTEHKPHNPHASIPAGEPYRAVSRRADDGGRRCRARACRARPRTLGAGGGLPAAGVRSAVGDPWPAEVIPDFTDVDIGIARTQPCYDDAGRGARGRGAVPRFDRRRRAFDLHREPVRHLRADRASAGAGGCARSKSSKSLIVAPQRHESWIEAHTMRNGRIRFWRMLRKRRRRPRRG